MHEELLLSLAEAKVIVADWQEDYNLRRPHSAPCMMPWAKFAAAWLICTPKTGPGDLNPIPRTSYMRGSAA